MTVEAWIAVVGVISFVCGGTCSLCVYALVVFSLADRDDPEPLEAVVE